ncbi:MAG: hypothetical protein J6R47_01010 [Acholeplasmatales bacterium]|nr:hypothetical protein [Acholeplasmatales bacterium]
MPQKFWKYKNHIIFYVQLIALLFVIFVVNLASVGWDITKVKYLTFGMMTFISIYSKIIATNYASNMELLPKVKTIEKDGKVSTIETNEIVILEKTIIDKYHELLEENRTGRFKDAMTYLRYTYRLKNEIDVVDCKFINNQKYKFNEFNIKKRKLLHELLQMLVKGDFKAFNEAIKNNEVVIYVNINKLSRRAMRSSNLKMSTLFATKTKGISEELDFSDSKITFNKWSYSFKTQFIFLIGMPILSFIWSGFTDVEYIGTNQIWIDMAGYTFSLVTGLFNGISIGTEAIQKGYLAKLQKRVETIQEILNIEKLITS